jgi:PAS domain S-box-containing protein
MNKYNRIEISDKFLKTWQKIAETIAKVTKVSSVLIIKFEDHNFKAIAVNKSDNSSHKFGDIKGIVSQFCEKIRKNKKKHLVSSAVKNEDYNNLFKSGYTAYLGYPIFQPDGEVFGSLCILDKKENDLKKEVQDLVNDYKELIEAQLEKIVPDIQNHADEQKKQIELFEKKFLAIFESINDAVTILKNFKFIDCNKKALQLFNCTKKQLIGKTPWEVSPEKQPGGLDSETAATNKINDVLKGKYKHFMWQHKSFDNTLIDVEINLTIIDKELGFFIAILKDREDQKREDDRRSAEQDYYAKLLDASPAYFVSIDANGRTIMMNSSMLKALGYSENEIKGKDYLSTFIPERGREKVSDIFEKKILLGKTSENENYVLTKDGRELLVAWHDCPITNSKGEVVYFFGIGIDITERKKAEAIILENNQILETVYNASDFLIAYMDKDYNFIRVNKQYADTIKKTPEHFIGKNHFDLFPDEENKAIFEKAVKTGLPLRYYAKPFSYPEHQELGITYWNWTIQPIKDKNNDVIAVVLYLLEVTEQEKTKIQLKESEERFRNIFNQGPIGIVLINEDFKFIAVNDKICDIIGYSKEELLEKKLNDIIYPEDIEADTKLNQKLFKNEIPYYTIERRYIHKSGRIIWINGTGTIVHDDNGESLYGLGMIQDITEKKQLQHEKQIKEIMLLRSQRLASLGGLASSIAHEIRQPLNLIKVISDAFIYMKMHNIESENSEEEFIKKMEQISGGVDRINRIIQNLQNLLKNSKKIEKEEQNLNKLLHESLAFFNQKIRNHGIKLELNLDNTLPDIIISSIQFHEIISSLISNAIDAHDTTTAKDKKIIIKTAPSINSLYLDVIDNGPGIEKERREKIFDPLYSTKFGKETMGLGLYMVNTVIDSMGGSIEVLDNEYGGATFHIIIPNK